jgi:hypothetical protein
MPEQTRDLDFELPWGLPRETARRALIALGLLAYFVVGFRVLPMLSAGRAATRVFLALYLAFRSGVRIG